jgi:hypothetical protein
LAASRADGVGCGAAALGARRREAKGRLPTGRELPIRLLEPGFQLGHHGAPVVELLHTGLGLFHPPEHPFVVLQE